MPSESQPPPESGTNSTDSSLSSAEETVREAMERSAGITRMAHMAAVASIERNLDVEDAAYQRAMGGHNEAQPATGEEMRIMAGGDVYVNPEPEPSLPPAPVSPKPTSILAKAAIVAAVLGSGVAGVAVDRAIHALKPPPAVETPADADTRYESRIELR